MKNEYTFQITKDLFDRLSEVAAKKNADISDLIEHALETYITIKQSNIKEKNQWVATIDGSTQALKYIDIP